MRRRIAQSLDDLVGLFLRDLEKVGIPFNYQTHFIWNEIDRRSINDTNPVKIPIIKPPMWAKLSTPGSTRPRTRDTMEEKIKDIRFLTGFWIRLQFWRRSASNTPVNPKRAPISFVNYDIIQFRMKQNTWSTNLELEGQENRWAKISKDSTKHIDRENSVGSIGSLKW